MLTSDNKILIMSQKKCSRCKKQFDFIDANNHCIDCWYYLLTAVSISDRIMLKLFDAYSRVQSIFSMNRVHKAQCLCEQCRGWITKC